MKLNFFFLSIILCAGSTEIMRRFAIKLNVVDRPSARKMQLSPIPYLGGIALVISFLGCFFVFANFLKSRVEINLLSIIVLMGLILLIVLMGLIDDIKTLNYKSKFILQVVTSSITGFVVSVSEFRAFSFDSILVNVFLTALWLIFFMNAVNFFDNMDGLLSGTVLLSLVAYLSHANRLDQLLIAAACLNLMGCLVGFLLFNFPNARIYLGDAGSLLLGFIIGLITIQIDFRNESFLSSAILLMLPILVIIIDSCLVVLFRIFRKVHPASPGKDHLSHRLMLLGRSKKQAVLEIWSLTSVSVLSSIFLIQYLWISVISILLISLRMVIVYSKTQQYFKVNVNGIY